MAKSTLSQVSSQAISMTEELRNTYGKAVIDHDMTTSTGKVVLAGTYAIVRATDKTICLGDECENSYGKYYKARGWFSWHLGVDGELVITEKLEAPKPKTKTQVYEDILGNLGNFSEPQLKELLRDVLTPKVHATKKAAETKASKPQPKAETVIKNESVHAGAWTIQGDVAISPKGRKWRVTKSIKDGWEIESKSGIKGTITNVGKYVSR